MKTWMTMQRLLLVLVLVLAGQSLQSTQTMLLSC
jgi:hypothetical protein